jgi:peptidoglycan/LPS O-acetylase OafA/YrhL
VERYYELDLFRFIAALSVVLFHYTFRGFASEQLSIIDYPTLGSFFKYGYLGVDLFFMISGFVILLTALNKDFKGFVISRVVRLYPAFWIAATITTIVAFFLGNNKFNVDIITYLSNLPIILGYFGVKPVDGVYWTLLIEIQFYALVGIIVYYRMENKAINFLFLWMLVSVVAPYISFPIFLTKIFLLKWSSYFIAGAVFYLIRQNGITIVRLVVLAGAYYLSIRQAYWRIPYLEEAFHADFSVVVILGIITFFYIIFFMFSMGWLVSINRKCMLFWGALTYPLYLIHENIGFMLFNTFADVVNKYLLLVIVILVVIISSFIIHKYLEKSISRQLRKALLG